MPPKKASAKAEKKQVKRGKSKEEVAKKQEVVETKKTRGRSAKAKSPSPPPAPIKKGKRKASKAAASPPPEPVVVKKKPTRAESIDESKLVKVVTKGGAAVDNLCPGKNDLRVLQENGKIYSATLNQSNVVHNNNKFYINQALQSEKNPNNFFHFTRWGRVGEPGQQALKGPMAKQFAINEYEKKMRDKTVNGDYIEIHLKFDDEPEEEKKVVEKPKAKLSRTKTPASRLPEAVQRLINLIFDTKVIDSAMKEIGYDPRKCPLGKLADSTIKEGYNALNLIMKAINKKQKAEIQTYTSQFYSLIPHDFGRQNMANFILDTEEKVRKKLEMLQSLEDMKITTKLLAAGTTEEEDIMDQNYKKLNIKLKPIPKTDDVFKLITDYYRLTQEHYAPKIVDIFEVERPGEHERYDYKVGNDMLLFHGSRVSNFVGILSQGLRIAPPEAPANGYNYGKGLYFADMIGKSCQYCGGKDNSYLCLLVQVAVGKPNVIEKTDYNASNLPKGTDSCLGWGTQGPDPDDYKQLPGDKRVQVPAAKVIRTKSKN